MGNRKTGGWGWKVFTISTEPSEGIVSRSALAFNLGVAGIRSLMGAANWVLGSILGAGRTVFLKVAAVGIDLMVGILSRMPTGVAMVREKKKKMAMGFILELCVLADYLFNSDQRWNCDSGLLNFIYFSFDGIIFRGVKIPLCGDIRVSQAPFNHN